MKQNKNKRIVCYAPHSVKGFTLIEFLVASMLAMIVIVAASGTYMITRKLNTSAQERISVQQDIRNASVQMARDARMAGSFGCFNTGNNGIRNLAFDRIDAKNADVKSHVFLDSGNQPSYPHKDGFGVRVIDKALLTGFSGLSNPSNALLFIYGQSVTAAHADNLISHTDYLTIPTAKSSLEKLTNVHFKRGNSTSSIVDESDALKHVLEKNGDVILSTCSEIVNVAGVKAFKDGTLDINATEIRASQKHVGELSLSKLSASLYVLGDINRAGRQWDDEKVLLRYDLGADGAWQNPQLLAMGIKSMSFAFGYVNDTNACKTDITSASNAETFEFFDNPRGNTTANQPPALVQVRLKYYVNKATGKAEDAKVRDYIINTTVRAGNTCANRLVKS